MPGSNVEGPEAVTGNESVRTNPPQRQPHPEHGVRQGKRKLKNELLHLLCCGSERAGPSAQARLRDLLGGLRRVAATRGLDFQAALRSAQGDGMLLPFAAFDPSI
jgi:hypothetical protein